MKGLICRILMRRLIRTVACGEHAAADPGLQAHLGSCKKCQSLVRDIRLLETNLAETLQTPKPTENFVTAVCARVEQRLPADRKMPWAWKPLAAFGAVAVFVWAANVWQAPVREQPRYVVNAGPPSIPKASEGKVKSAETTAKNQGTEKKTVGTPKRPRKKTMATPKAVPPIVGKTVLVQSTPQKERQIPWLDWAAYLEFTGDYARAADAYARAYEQKADPSIAYAAGCTAETAGDVGRAIDYYASVLNTPVGSDR
jgi:hypothetical protein